MSFWRVGILILAVNFSALAQKISLDSEMIYRLLDGENPYVAIALANQKIQESRVISAKGGFDTKLGAKHDEKRYPLGDGRLSDVYLEKPLESGVEVLMGYRKAYGTQEYNNIKTGDEGEMRVGVKIPIVPLIHGTNDRYLSLKLAQIDSQKSLSGSTKNLRELSYTVMRVYYQLLFRHELMELERGLLQKAQMQYQFIEKRVAVGDEAPILLVEARQNVNERKQRLIESANAVSTAEEHLISYLNIPAKEFEEIFEIPNLPLLSEEVYDVEVQMEKVLKNRPEIEILEFEKEKLKEELMMAQTLKYPQIDAALYGVHDQVYQNGFKVSLEMAFPIERRKYEGKSSELQMKKENNINEMKKSLLEARRVVTTAVETLNSLKENLMIVQNEIALAEQLERAEMRKFELGESGLFLLNQREMKTLYVKQKKSEYHLKILMSLLEIEKESGDMDQRFLPLIRN
jgi:outer membrane protein TolC